MKIVIVSSYFGNVIGGALNFIIDLYTELESRGNLVTLVLDERYKELFSERRFRIIWFSSAKITSYSPSLSFLKIISKIDADVIHLHGYLSFQTDFGALIANLRKIPVILTPHGSLLGYEYLYDSSTSKLPYRIHDVLTLKLPTKISKKIIATSQAEFKDCKKFGIPENKIKLIPLSFNPPNISKDKQKSNKKIRLLFVGRIVPLKNLDVLLKAVKIVKKDIPEIEFTIVGEEISGRLHGDIGYKQKLLVLVNELKIKENVKFVGWKTGKELWDIYQNSDLFLFASTYENFGLPLLEAAYFRLPLVSTDVGVAKDLIDVNKGGNIISKLDANEFAENIITLLKNDLKHEEASKFVFDKSKNFLIKSIAKKYEEIYTGCIRNE
jgi:glycosyltransferase involved in cell wall biosynthesis